MVFFQPGSLSSRAHLGFSSLRTCLDKNIEESYHPQKTSRFPCASQELKMSLFSAYFSKKTPSACISLSDHVLSLLSTTLPSPSINALGPQPLPRQSSCALTSSPKDAAGWKSITGAPQGKNHPSPAH